MSMFSENNEFCERTGSGHKHNYGTLSVLVSTVQKQEVN